MVVKRQTFRSKVRSLFGEKNNGNIIRLPQRSRSVDVVARGDWRWLVLRLAERKKSSQCGKGAKTYGELGALQLANRVRVRVASFFDNVCSETANYALFRSRFDSSSYARQAACLLRA